MTYHLPMFKIVNGRYANMSYWENYINHVEDKYGYDPSVGWKNVSNDLKLDYSANFRYHQIDNGRINFLHEDDMIRFLLTWS